MNTIRNLSWRPMRGTLLALALVLPMAASATAQATPMGSCLTWTADATGIIYCDAEENGLSELFEFDGSGRPRQLTYLGGHILSADVSDGGSTITFHATLPNDPDPQVYVIARSGQRAHIVIVGGSVIDIPGARALRLTDAGSNVEPRFIDGDARIGFASDRSGPLSLWSMNIDGSDQRELLVAAND